MTLFSQARKFIPGGVNSPVRSFRQVGGEPVFISSGRGSKIYSQSGQAFIDYCQSYGALILGHSHPEVVKAVQKAAARGTSFGAPTSIEIEIAKLIMEAIPSIEKIRLTNSGTEAVMSAIRLARAFTRKKAIIKFEGSYHGHADYLLNGPGIPEDFTRHTIVLPYNDIQKAAEIISRFYKNIAAIIVEPVAGNMGVVLPEPGFLKALRDLTYKYKMILIFDEVITGFRISYSGAQGYFKIRPDLTCLGKIIGGGLPVGAYGGRREIMRLVAPEGKVYQAGTFSGNPVTVSAGLTALSILKETAPYERLERNTARFCREINSLAKVYGLELRINNLASMFSLFFTDREVIDYRSAGRQDQALFKKFFHGLLKEGIYLSPSGLETNFISTAHSESDLERTLEAIKKTFKKLKG